MSKSLRILIIVGGVAALVIIAGIAQCRAMIPEQVASLLDIPKLPPSVSDVHCDSRGITDVFVMCSFAVAPDDLPKLMTAHRFLESKPCPPGPIVESCTHLPGRSHEGPIVVGPDFEIVASYVARPPEFEHGGSITLGVDKARRRVLLTYYRE